MAHEVLHAGRGRPSRRRWRPSRPPGLLLVGGRLAGAVEIRVNVYGGCPGFRQRHDTGPLTIEIFISRVGDTAGASTTFVLSSTVQLKTHDTPARCRTPMHHYDHDVLHVILLRLGASSADQVELRETARREPPLRLYRAMRGDRWTYVDRALAVRLREIGAVWSGELLRDPCAVA